VNDRIDATKTGEDVLAESLDVADVEEIDDGCLPRHGIGGLTRQVRVAVHNNDVVIRPERASDDAACHPRAEHNRNRPAHAASPVMPLAESMAGASDFRSDS
jgi:hypothetical protein